jgi:tetratricopeptide (TPR) repeat protein
MRRLQVTTVATLNPDYAEAYSNRNYIYELRRYDEALASYDRAIEIKSDNHQTHSNRGTP